MIKSICIKNFKSIRKERVNLRNLTLLFGMNGMGKSSTIQSLLLCRQSFWHNGKNDMGTLFPNGELIELGTIGDIYCENADSNVISFEVEYETFSNKYSYEVPIGDLQINSLSADNSSVNIDVPEFRDDFVYLSAEHIGPKRKYNYSTWNDNGINRFGMHGEYTVPFLAMHGDSFVVPEELCIDTAKSNHLIDQVCAWMDKISPGIRLNTELLNSDLEAKLKVSYNGEWSVSSAYSPVNVGFGISYVLPIIVAILTIPKGGIILIENPESHLHPKGQSAIAELMALGAAYGKQIICESHSDHVINGVRVAVKEKEINNNDVSIVYYSKDSQLNSVATPIRLDANGNLDRYPEGLLDEWGELMSRLI